MDDSVERSILRAVEEIRRNLGEELTVDDIARVAMFSKFHFTRIFGRATGLSPGRFLSAVRLDEAKRLLLSTSLSVTEICNRVGYSAVGTFSTRFKHCVGMAPIQYRQCRGLRPRALADRRPDGPIATIRGTVAPPPESGPESRGERVFVGLFPDRVPAGLPVRRTLLDHAGTFELEQVPSGTWHVLAHSVGRGETANGRRTPAFAIMGPISAKPDNSVKIDIRTRPMAATDPPILPVLLDAPQ